MRKNQNHFLKDIGSALCHLAAMSAKKKLLINAKIKECVIPLCASNSVETGIHIPAMKSISGTLCANAPHNIAFLPACLSRINSPIQAPKTTCVIESMSDRIDYAKLFKCLFNKLPISSITLFLLLSHPLMAYHQQVAYQSIY